MYLKKKIAQHLAFLPNVSETNLFLYGLISEYNDIYTHLFVEWTSRDTVI